MNYIMYRVPYGEPGFDFSGLTPIGYAENYHFASLPDITQIPTVSVTKYGIREVPEQVCRGIKFYISTKVNTKMYKNDSSGQADEYFDMDFDQTMGVRLQRHMTDEEIVDRYEAIRYLRIQVVKDYFKQKFLSLNVLETPQEQATWRTQETEARAYILDNTVSTPILSTLANAKGVTVLELANKVINAVDRYNLSVANLLAEQEGFITTLKNAVDDDIINTVIPVERTIIPGDSRFVNNAGN